MPVFKIYNPTPARRVIFDGLENSKKRLEINPGQTIDSVELSGAVASRLMKNRGADDRGRPVELIVTLLEDEVEEAEEKPSPGRPAAPSKPVAKGGRR